MPTTFLTALASAALLAGQAPPEAPPRLATGEAHLAPLWDALADVEAGQRDRPVRIAWWGDSAIVSDGYTGEIRARLQARFGDGGPGFVLAAPSFDGYLRKGVRLKRHKWETHGVLRGERKDGRYGFGGVVASSWGGSGSTYILEHGAPIDHVEVWHRVGPKLGGLQLFADEAGQPTASVSTAADVAADHVWSPRLDSPARHLRLRASGGGLVRVYGVVLERSGPGIVLDALGVIGLRARRWTKHADAEHMAGQVASRQPDLLVVAFGGNERVDPGLTPERHEADITALLKLMRAATPRAACLVFGPIAHGKKGTRLDPALDTIYLGQQAAAARAGCAFFDTIAAMGGDESVAQFRQRKLMGRDLAHLNPKGHAEVGRLFTDWLLDAYARR